MKQDEKFFWSGQDSLSQFVVWVVVLGGGSASLSFIAWSVGGKLAALVCLAVACLFVVGLRTSISISPLGVEVKKHWFFVIYRRYRGPRIEDVSFGGDWGEPEGASGVVVNVGGKEVHIGSRRTMHYLHKTLTELRRKHAAQQLAQADSPTSLVRAHL